MPDKPSPYRAWIPLALTILIAATFVIVYRQYILCVGGDCTPDASLLATLTSLSEVSGAAQRAALPYRVLWLAMLGTSVLLSVICVAGSMVCIAQLDRQRRWVRLTLTGGLAILVTLVFYAVHSSTPDHLWRQFMHAGLLADFPAAMRLMPLLDALALFTTLSIACAVTCLIAEATDPDVPHTLTAVIQLRRWMNLILYLSAAELVVSLVRNRFFMDWSAAYVLPLPANASDSLKLASSSITPIILAVTTSIAILYTMFLLAISIPTAMAIRTAGDALVAQAQPPTREEVEWARMTGIGAQLSRLLAILSPFLSGIVAELIKAVK